MRFPYLGYGGVRFAWKFEPRLNHVLLLAGDHMGSPLRFILGSVFIPTRPGF